MAVRAELSKNKSYAMLPGFVVVALISLFLLLSACGIFPMKMRIEPAALIIFSLLLLSSGYFIYLTIRKLNNKQAGLIADDEGFIYNGTALGSAIGYIKWQDIKTLNAVEGLGNSYLTVEVYNPDCYLNKIKSNFLRNQTKKRIQGSEKHRGILLTISANGLQDFEFSELERLFINKLADFHKEE
ncbi:MAG: hypothetical protein LBG19_04855 [Prevotellaceae bacterium]|jgi:hypothetical protein|nr:hypothetical protein [Prevotellaceae bacterium]